MLNQFSRTTMMFGEKSMEELYKSSVIIFGIGGVGGYSAEALARSGIGRIGLVDDDVICVTNINRQIIATHDSIGKNKVDVMKERILSINKSALVECYKMFYLPENADMIDLSSYDYAIDALDTVTAKLEIATRASVAGIPMISCMGAANKMNPCAFSIKDIFETDTDPLAKVMRRELRKRGIDRLKVVVSSEKAVKRVDGCLSGCETGCVCPPGTQRKCNQRRQIPASNAFVPAIAGLIAASEAVADIIYKAASSSRISSITS